MVSGRDGVNQCVMPILLGVYRLQSRPRRTWRRSSQCWTNTWQLALSSWGRGSAWLILLWPAPWFGSSNRFDIHASVTRFHNTPGALSFFSALTDLVIFHMFSAGVGAILPSAISQREPLVCHLRQPASVQGYPRRSQALWKDGPVWWWVANEPEVGYFLQNKLTA